MDGKVIEESTVKTLRHKQENILTALIANITSDQVCFRLIRAHSMFSFNSGVVAERIRAPNSSSADSVQQNVGSNPGRDTCVIEQDT